MKRILAQKWIKLINKQEMKDKIFRSKNKEIKSFEFNEEVVDVFPDMIERSVPGYKLLQSMIIVMAQKYVQNNSNVYDLGCSLGETSFAIQEIVDNEGVKIIAVDNSRAMINKCIKNTKNINRDIKIEFIMDDILKITIKNASFVVMNFSLQFIPVDERDRLINKIFDGLASGGVLILSEKIIFNDSDEDEIMISLHDKMKKINGYEESEIANKRKSLEDVLIPEAIESHYERLRNAGFRRSYTWLKCMNFISIIAIK